MKELNSIEAELKDLLSARPAYTRDPKYHRFQGYPHKVLHDKRKRNMDMVRWCNAHCKGNYSLDASTSKHDVTTFENKDDAILFKLTWGGAV